VTVKTLFLLRHAKSSWDEPDLADKDRPLATRGERAARRMAEHMRAHRIRPALVLCSPAVRARATLDLVAAGLGSKTKIHIDDRIYGADAADLLAIVRSTPESVPSLLLVGHNPTMHDLALDLMGDGDGDAVARMGLKFPTGALACLSFGAKNWPGLAPGRGYLESFTVPRELA
jgi:phosphohistidine phosphatase